MSIDTKPIRELADALAAEITNQLDDTDQSGFVRQAMVCIEIDLGPSTRFFTISADDRPWVQTAFLDAVADHIQQRRQAANTGWEDQ